MFEVGMRISDVNFENEPKIKVTKALLYGVTPLVQEENNIYAFMFNLLLLDDKHNGYKVGYIVDFEGDKNDKIFKALTNSTKDIAVHDQYFGSPIGLFLCSFVRDAFPLTYCSKLDAYIHDGNAYIPAKLTKSPLTDMEKLYNKVWFEVSPDVLFGFGLIRDIVCTNGILFESYVFNINQYLSCELSYDFSDGWFELLDSSKLLIMSRSEKVEGHDNGPSLYSSVAIYQITTKSPASNKTYTYNLITNVGRKTKVSKDLSEPLDVVYSLYGNSKLWSSDIIRSSVELDGKLIQLMAITSNETPGNTKFIAVTNTQLKDMLDAAGAFI